MHGPGPHIEHRIYAKVNRLIRQNLRARNIKHGISSEFAGRAFVHPTEFPFCWLALRSAGASGSPISCAFQSFSEDWPPLGPPSEWRGDQLRDVSGTHAFGDAEDLFSRTNGFSASAGPNRTSAGSEHRCGSEIFAHGLPERRHRHDKVRCERVQYGALRGNGCKSAH